MEDGRSLLDELAQAARCLEARLALLRVPTDRIPHTEWGKLADEIRDAIPAWLVTLLGEYALYGTVLEYPDRAGKYTCNFILFGPREYAIELKERTVVGQLLGTEWTPFAYETDGNVWVVRKADGPGSAVHLLKISSWDGGPPNERNGLVFASSRLSYLFATMGVSPVSFDDDPKGPRRVLWYPDE